MSENSQENQVEEMSAVDAIFDGGPQTDTHSQKTAAAEVQNGSTENENPPEVFGDDEDYPFADDSGTGDEKTGKEVDPGAAENKPDDGNGTPASPSPENKPGEKTEKTPETPDASALKQEVETLTKRLHDTQKKMHEATEQRAALKKQLDELQAKKDENDDWFSESDNEKLEKLGEDLKKSEKEVEELGNQGKDLENKTALAVWDAAVAEVKKTCPDFDKVVYEGFAPMLDEKGGDPRVKQLWALEKDKSPANAYKFAKRLPDILEMMNDPEAYKAKIRGESSAPKTTPEETSPKAPTGKQGLDMIPSATVANAKGKAYSESAVDDIFGGN